ncbi:TIGR01212 family radical SAM protein [Anaerosinus sp.]|uniref:TIGR01212 family radical SAM protein n=1 Tax=Selenobaculum sp. TaxID=3074374 RepID=UPI0015ACE7BF
MIYNAYSDDLKKRYGEKVYKLPVGLPLTCPNRDGVCGVSGCTFCGEIGAGYENLPADMTVTEQINANRAHISPKYKAEKFIAYFQNFSNTYLPVEKLRCYLEEACQDDIVGIAIATRPDCIHDDYLAMMKEVKEKYQIDISIELGLQSVNYHSLIKVNRGHTLAEYIDAVMRIKKYDLAICTHLILNLPWDDMTDVIENAKMMSALQMNQVKLHALYIVKETKMAREYEAGGIQLISKEEYMERVITFLEYLDDKIVVQRLIGRAPESNTLFSNWQTGWWKIRDTILKTMQERGTYQGRLCNYLNGSAVRRFVK